MSLGGGSYIIENKVIPGAYINFVTTKRGSVTFNERGVGVLAMELDWGSGIVIAERESIREDSKKLFGYDYDNRNMICIREFFRHADKLIAYNINSGGRAATFVYGAAAKEGARGNDLTVVISENVDSAGKFDVDVYLDSELVNSQTIAAGNEYVKNDFIEWKNTTTEIVKGTYKLSGGTTGNMTGSVITNFCKAIEEYSFNAVAVLVDDEDIEEVMIEFTKRMREEKGIKFQCVTLNVNGDHEGVVTVYNGSNRSGYPGYYILAWVCGALAGCPINESLTNMKYDGELEIATNGADSAVERAVKYGYFLFHKVDGETRVLKDINTFRSFTESKGAVMQNNQTVRVCDQIAADVAALFCQYYIGKVPNDKAGRNSLWSELVKYHENLMAIRAIEDFDEEDIEVSQGEDKTSVVISETILPVNAMDKLYMKVYLE